MIRLGLSCHYDSNNAPNALAADSPSEARSRMRCLSLFQFTALAVKHYSHIRPQALNQCAAALQPNFAGTPKTAEMVNQELVRTQTASQNTTGHSYGWPFSFTLLRFFGRGQIRTSDLSVPNHRCGKKLSFCLFESCSHHEFIRVLRFFPAKSFTRARR